MASTAANGGDPAVAGAPAAVDALALRTTRWIGVLFLLEVLLQRFQVPGTPVAILLPILIGWVVLALRVRLVEIDIRRLLLWAILTGSSGVALMMQTAFLPAPLISTDSWMLFLVVWLPAIVRLVDRRPTTYLLVLRRVIAICTGLAATCIVMMTSQLVGVGYQDYTAQFVPPELLLDGFIITYPIEFGSSIVRSNAWIGLEPSIISFQIGLGLLAAVLTRAPWWQSLVMAIGLFTVFAGSGFFVLLVGAAVMLFFPARRLLLPYALPTAVLGVLAMVTPLTQPLIERSSSELSDENSSASLRAVQPYVELWPRWSKDPLTALLGRGAGSAQRYANDLSVDDILVPTLGRILWDYGLIGGTIVVVALLFYYVDGPSAAIAFSLVVSLWALQPGGSQVVFALPLMVMVTFFAPRPGRRIEDDLTLTAAPLVPRRRRSLLVRRASPRRGPALPTRVGHVPLPPG